MSTMKDVASLAGVSGATVSRVLNGTAPVKQSTRERVQEAIRESGYQQNRVAASLVGGRTMTIGLVLPAKGLSVLGNFVSAVIEVAAGLGYAVLVGEARANPEAGGTALNMFLERRVDGVLIAQSRSQPHPQLPETQTPLVVIEVSRNHGIHPVCSHQTHADTADLGQQSAELLLSAMSAGSRGRHRYAY